MGVYGLRYTGRHGDISHTYAQDRLLTLSPRLGYKAREIFKPLLIPLALNDMAKMSSDAAFEQTPPLIVAVGQGPWGGVA